ncbi:MAG: biotin carboxylase [Deltaproteobacteria bacterium]|jgi:acetyl-CoA carboxylase biotin carboxylase subunit|nr:biotin carboxylase [Deltaproteobacteria bacterium]
MFKRVAVPNRGAVASRVVRALNELGVESLILCSEADKDNPYVAEATFFKVIGPSAPRESYLNQDAVIRAALEGGCDALHPGYGFLSENWEFARKTGEAGLVFIGPSPEFLKTMGDKVSARAVMGGRGFPLSPSTGTLLGTLEEMAREAEKIGFPLLIKPAGGGGGIGMIPVFESGKLQSGLKTAASQAERGFGKSELYAERLLINPRHVEFQIVADGREALHLHERDCSTQRRRQKVVEEAGAPGIEEALLRETAEKAARALASLGYDHLGTVETLYSRESGFSFLELNPRLQVEHAATEEVTGTDLVKIQLRLASGEKLKDILPAGTPEKRGHAVEARIYAEDPLRFLPSPGPLKVFRPPYGGGVRVETGFKEGGVVTPFYDPMIAQVIARGETRGEALDKLSSALEAFRVEGVKTNIPFILALLRHPPFREGGAHTGTSEELVKSPGYPNPAPEKSS